MRAGLRSEPSGYQAPRIVLSNNENPLGAAPSVGRALRSFAAERYPDETCAALRDALARRHAVDAGHVLMGAGSTALIFELVAALATGARIIAPAWTFVGYRLAAKRVGAAYVECGTSLSTDLDALLAGITDDTRIVCLANPGNPTGAFVPHEPLRDFVARVPPTVTVIVDEAYAEYVAPPHACEGVSLLRDFENVVVLRTFSKAWGLAGLRVGYAMGAPRLLAAAQSVRAPFSVSSSAQAAALAALSEHEHLERSVALVRRERDRLTMLLRERGFEVLPSQGNFVTVRVGAPEFVRALAEHGISVLSLANYGLPEWIRVSVGMTEENDAFLAALRVS